MKNNINVIFSVVIALIIFASMSIFTVDQRKFALVSQFGEVKRIISEPGLNFKFPLIQDVRFFEKRIITMDSAEPERFITSEKKNVLVDSYIKWQIVDPKLYYISFDGDESRAKIRLNQTINAGLREEFGKRTVHDVISGERDKIMEQMRTKANIDTKKVGIKIVYVRLKRVELPFEVSEAVFRRMEAERKRVANELRSEGAAEAEKIRADADKQREIIIANAYRDAQKIKGEGDAKAAAIYAAAFSDNPDFYAFYRSLEAYGKTFSNKNDILVISPDSSEFFKYLQNKENK